MREWRRAHKGQFCGGCRRPLEPIPEGTPFLVITRDDVKLARCPKCAKAMFGEDPPAVIDDAVAVPVPSLPLDLHRGPDVVTRRQVARSVHYNDVKSRASGERE